MEIEGSRGEDKEGHTEGDVVVVREDDRLGLLREISSNPRLENNVRLRTLSLGPQNCPLINLLTILIIITNTNILLLLLLLRFSHTLGSLTLFKLPDSALYFLSHMERILSASFIPSSEDMIRMRRATTGIQVS